MTETCHEDARVVKTKAKLTDEFSKLLCEKKFEDITVNELCERSGVRRATFYKHFCDKYAFLEYFVGNLREKFDKRFPTVHKKDGSPADYYVEYVVAVVDFLVENDTMVKNALDSDMLPNLINVIMERNFEDTLQRLKHSSEVGIKLPASAEITASMMTGAVTNTLLHWLRGGKTLPVDKLCSEISSVISAIVKEI